MPFLSAEIIRDVIASRPAAGSAGRIFFSSDEGKTYRDNGSSWDDASDAGVVTSVAGRTGVITLAESDLSVTDITTNNVSSTAHGFAPKSPADATHFLNGATTPAFAAVKDSDLSTSDITTNNVSTSKHGFTPKLPNDATKFLDGTGAYSVPPGTGTIPNFADKETPSGTVDGSNQVFTLAHTPNPADSLQFIRQGVHQIEGTDFTISGNTITYSGSLAPATGDLQRAWYRY